MRRSEYEAYQPVATRIKAEPLESVLWDIAKRFEVLDVAYLKDFVGPCHPNFYSGIKQALRPF
jgi:hypothetical protein